MIRNYDNWRSLNESRINPEQRVLLDLGLLDLTQDQIYWLERGTEGTWSINEETGLVDIDGSFYFGFKELTDLCGLRFGKVTGAFDCSGNDITSLSGAPRWVGGSFWCNRNELSSLEGAPDWVGGDFDCSNNHLKLNVIFHIDQIITVKGAIISAPQQE